jgi:ketosteroid isomerase-like protein
MAQQHSTRAAVQELYAAYQRGDRDGVASLIDDEVDWTIYGPVEVFAFAGHRQGKPGALASLAGIAQNYALDRYDLEAVVVDGDRAAVMSDVAFTQRATGRLLRFHVADFLRFRNGRLVEFREFCDSFDVVAQALGHYPEVGPAPSA